MIVQSHPQLSSDSPMILQYLRHMLGILAAVIQVFTARAASLRTVFQLRPVPRVASL